MFEIWVCSPRVEGVHLRNGRIARGGIRWSDRREDFRTEILGLVKAQIVKNAVIVPTGAKGGFVLKKPPAGADEFRAEGVACYRQFISGLLDLTDNIVGGAIVPPPDTVRHDGDDPYLVVAADKGTATFSDIANEISADVRLLARRRVRLRWQRRLRPQGDGHHRARRVGERAPPRRVRLARMPITTSSPSSASATCRATCSATGCCGRRTSSSWPRSTTATSSSTPIPIRRCRSPSASDCSSCRDRVGPTTTPSLLSAGGGVYPRTLKTIALSPEARKRLGTDQTDVHARTSCCRPSFGRPSTCCGTAGSAPTSRHRRRRTPRSATEPTTACASTVPSCAAGWSARAGTSA